MSRNIISEAGVSPFLHQFAVNRTDATDIEGHYSEQEKMWVVSSHQGVRPLIDVASCLAELVTKTMAYQENDDERHMDLLELSTKTESAPESDDQVMSSDFALELSTKTAAQAEGDDTRPTSPSFF